MADKYFNRREAEALLPVIEHHLVQAREQKETVDHLDMELARAGARIMMLGGSIPPYKELKAKRAQRESVVAVVEESVNKIQATGCVVKDLDEGLVDFPSLIQGQEAFLCWKLGEEGIAYWHGLEEGFAGRKPLDNAPPEKPPGPARFQ